MLKIKALALKIDALVFQKVDALVFRISVGLSPTKDL
jgi:hypothetical protein